MGHTVIHMKKKVVCLQQHNVWPGTRKQGKLLSPRMGLSVGQVLDSENKDEQKPRPHLAYSFVFVHFFSQMVTRKVPQNKNGSTVC